MLRDNKGFTLIELMIVVAIIGILAAIAVPNFLRFVAKTRKSEAKYNLEAIYKAEVSYFGEYDRFSNSFATIRWQPIGTIYFYTFSVGTEFYGLPVASNPNPGVAPAATDLAFTAFAWGNIDDDPAKDVWSIDDLRTLTNTSDDMN